MQFWIVNCNWFSGYVEDDQIDDEPQILHSHSHDGPFFLCRSTTKIIDAEVLGLADHA